MRAVVGRVCKGNRKGEVDDFVASTIGTGVWFGKGGVVLTADHVVEGLTVPIFFYLYHPRTGVWIRRLMRVVAEHSSWDIAVLQQQGPAEMEGHEGNSDYEPLVLEALWAQPDADAWSIAFPQIIDETLTPTSSSSHLSSPTSSSIPTGSATASSSSVSSSSHSLSSLPFSSSSPSTASSSSVISSPSLLTSESSSTPASSSSSSSSSVDEKGDEKRDLSSTALSPSSFSTSTSTSDSSSAPTSFSWKPQSPVITKGIISKVGFDSLIQIADYIAPPNSSGGAVVGQGETGEWYLIGIHIGVVHHDIDKGKTLYQQLTDASGTSPFAVFISILSIQSWLDTALPPNCQVVNSSTNRKGPVPIVGGKRRRGSATAQSARAAIADEGGEGVAEDEDELVYEVEEGWAGYYDRRVNPVPLPARPRTQSDPFPSHATASRPAGGGTTGGRDTRSL